MRLCPMELDYSTADACAMYWHFWPLTLRPDILISPLLYRYTVQTKLSGNAALALAS